MNQLGKTPSKQGNKALQFRNQQIQASIIVQKSPSNNNGMGTNKMHEQGKVGRIWAKGDIFMHKHEHTSRSGQNQL